MRIRLSFWSISIVVALMLCQPSEPLAQRISQGENPQIARVKNFVRAIYFHGIPYAEARNFDSTVVPTLQAMLRDKTAQRYWPNIVVTLSDIGGEEALSAIEGFIKQKGDSEKGYLSENEMRTKRSAIMALGNWINQSSDKDEKERILKALAGVVQKEHKATETVQTKEGNAPPNSVASSAETRRNTERPTQPIDLSGFVLDDHQKDEFASAALIGLALSGDEETLKRIKNAPHHTAIVSGSSIETLESNPLSKHLDDPRLEAVLDEALKANEEIRQKGLNCYYGGRYQKKSQDCRYAR